MILLPKRLLALWALFFPLSPFVYYLSAEKSNLVSTHTILASLVFTLSVVLLPIFAKLPKTIISGYLVLINLWTILTHLSVQLSGAFPSATVMALALKTDPREAYGFLAVNLITLGLVLTSGIPALYGSLKTSALPSLAQVFNIRLSILGICLLAIPSFFNGVSLIYPASSISILVKLRGVAEQASFVDMAEKVEILSNKAGHDNTAIVLVIGESSQADYWQLDGYPKKTTPRLTARHNAGELINFSKHMSTAEATYLAVPSLISPNEQPIVFDNTKLRKSVVSVMHAAGYSTGWLSVQSPQPASAEADATDFDTDFFNYRIQSAYDEKLVGSASNWLRLHQDANTFLVLHTLGSHLPFEHRYPEAFDTWRRDKSAHYPQSQSTANYENTINYTDYVLDQLIKTLEKEHRPTILVFASDHGESLMKGVSRARGPIQDVLHVPFFIWGNSLWRNQHPTTWAALRDKEADDIVTHHFNVVPTLTSLLGIDYKGKPYNRDLLNRSFTPWVTTPAVDTDHTSYIQVKNIFKNN